MSLLWRHYAWYHLRWQYLATRHRRLNRTCGVLQRLIRRLVRRSISNAGISDGASLFLLHAIQNGCHDQAGGNEKQQTDTDDHPFEAVWIGV